MNKSELATIREYRKAAKKAGVNRYRFAWWLFEKHPNLVISIIGSFIKQLEAMDEK